MIKRALNKMLCDNLENYQSWRQIRNMLKDTLVDPRKGLFINYITQSGGGGGQPWCYAMVRCQGKKVFLALGMGEGVNFGPKWRYIMNDSP